MNGILGFFFWCQKRSRRLAVSSLRRKFLYWHQFPNIKSSTLKIRALPLTSDKKKSRPLTASFLFCRCASSDGRAAERGRGRGEHRRRPLRRPGGHAQPHGRLLGGERVRSAPLLLVLQGTDSWPSFLLRMPPERPFPAFHTLSRSVAPSPQGSGPWVHGRQPIIDINNNQTIVLTILYLLAY